MTDSRVSFFNGARYSPATILVCHSVVRHWQSMNMAGKQYVQKPVGFLFESCLLKQILQRMQIGRLTIKQPLLVVQCTK